MRWFPLDGLAWCLPILVQLIWALNGIFCQYRFSLLERGQGPLICRCTVKAVAPWQQSSSLKGEVVLFPFVGNAEP